MNSNAKLKKLLELGKKRYALEQQARQGDLFDSLPVEEEVREPEETKAAEKQTEFVDTAGWHRVDVLALYTDSPDSLTKSKRRKIRNYQSSCRNRSDTGPYGWMS